MFCTASHFDPNHSILHTVFRDNTDFSPAEFCNCIKFRFIHPPLSEIVKKLGKMLKYTPHIQSAFGTGGLQQLPSAHPGVRFNQLLHAGDVFWCPRFQGPTGADSLLQGESAALDLTNPTLDGFKGKAGLSEGDGEVLMDLDDGFPKFVATQRVGAKVWIFHMQRQPDKVIKIWLASFLMGCLGKMQDGFQPKIAQETRYG